MSKYIELSSKNKKPSLWFKIAKEFPINNRKLIYSTNYKQYSEYNIY